MTELLVRPMDLYRYQTFTLGVRALARRYPFSVTSWWRTPAHNEGLKDAVADSQHQEGTACDVVFDPGQVPDAGPFRAAARELGLEVHPEADHWHLELVSNLY